MANKIPKYFLGNWKKKFVFNNIYKIQLLRIILKLYLIRKKILFVLYKCYFYVCLIMTLKNILYTDKILYV